MSHHSGSPISHCAFAPFCHLLATQEDADRSKLGPGYAAILVSVTDAGLGGKLLRAFQGISTPQAIASSACTSALAHPEDAAVASYNIHLCGSDKVRSKQNVSANDRVSRSS